MDFLKKFSDNNAGEGERRPEESTESGERTQGNFFDKASNFMNEQAGGGKKGEQKEDALDKGNQYNISLVALYSHGYLHASSTSPISI
ncbi:hypothetical protein TWF569_001529 [Orbilia oligospora]|nr:hypothetical protein TWF706_000991 [Orbilia oligospora]KAF3124043.1 hypothetical protein TWF569_001529 [Orbilia oligospora]KAF3165596.1 hypothetical protein TWF225_001183 [Orbilia oligospora]KAF3238292.1 hypothetical protein TWF128_000626 [Orbilia oligospora]KAF3239752.1 hypothetical protein TWF217_001189 [Orbilia oligospora]